MLLAQAPDFHDCRLRLSHSALPLAQADVHAAAAHYHFDLITSMLKAQMFLDALAAAYLPYFADGAVEVNTRWLSPAPPRPRHRAFQPPPAAALPRHFMPPCRHGYNMFTAV